MVKKRNTDAEKKKLNICTSNLEINVCSCTVAALLYICIVIGYTIYVDLVRNKTAKM